MAAPTREHFPAQVVEIVSAKFPLVKISACEQPFSVKVNGHVASLENLYRLSALRPDEVKHHVERWMVELLRASEGSPDQVASFDEIKERIFPMILSDSAAELDPASMVTQSLVDGLVIAYAVDNDRTIAYIPRRHFESWKVTPEALHETALANLVRESETLSAQAAQDEDGSINLILFQTMDGYDAARILLPTLHDRLREHLGSPFVAGIPNRDILLCFRNDEPTVERLRQQIAEDNRQMPHPVTPRLLLITADGIAPHNSTPPPNNPAAPSDTPPNSDAPRNPPPDLA
jgi:uncharacterized protein YtpQ (UPF0354 family)